MEKACTNATARQYDGDILDAFQKHALDLSRPMSTATTLSQCLRLVVGKQRPSPAVKKVLLKYQQCHPASLHAAHQTLRQADYWQSTTEDTTTGFYVQRVSCLVWFVQFVLEASSHGLPMDADADADPDTPSVKPILPQAQANQMAVALLNHLARTMVGILHDFSTESSKDSHGVQCVDGVGLDADTMDLTRFDPPMIASFAIGVMIRGIQSYVATRPILLSPLWKGICDMAAPLSRLNPELAEETLQALLSYLGEGARAVVSSSCVAASTTAGLQQVSPEQQQKQQDFHTKVLVFLVARLTTLLPVYIKSQSQSTGLLTCAWTTLCQLRGLGMAVDAHNARSSGNGASISPCLQYQSLERKIDQCVFKTICNAEETTEDRSDRRVLDNSALTALLSCSLDSDENSSCSFGKAMILLSLLRHLVGQERIMAAVDSELSLSMCEELLFSTLPRCYPHLTGDTATRQSISTMLSEVHDLVVASISRVIASGEDGPASVPRQSIVERLLIRWLGSASMSKKQQRLHPVSRELVVSVVFSYIVQSCSDDSRSQSPRSVHRVVSDKTDGGNIILDGAPEILATMAKLVFDARTFCEHRRNISSVLLRIANSCNTQPLGRAVAKCIGAEFVKYWKEDCMAEKRKRKRNPVQSHSSPGFGIYEIDDMEVVMEVLASSARSADAGLDGPLSTFCRELALDEYAALDRKRAKGCRVCHHSPASVSLLLSALRGVVDDKSAECESTDGSFRRRTGQRAQSLCIALVGWLSKIWLRIETSKRVRIDRSQSVVTVACLHFVRQVCDSFGASFPLDTLGLVQTTLVKCTKQASLIRQQCRNDPKQQRRSLSILFAAIDLLPALASVTPSDCPRRTLEGIAETFKIMLVSASWPIVARAMSSLVDFASRLPSAHKHILPLCVTPDAQGLLQCRLQNKVYTSLSTIASAKEDSLRKLIPSRLGTTSDLFSTRATQDVPAGSYLLTMPTNNGRSALVIFPPGEESLDDIKYMLGSDNLDEVDVRRFRRAHLVDGGSGCLLRSTSL